MTNKTQDRVLITLGIVFFILGAICLYGAFKAFNTIPHFYDGNENELPYHAVDSLVKSRYVHLTNSGYDTLVKYGMEVKSTGDTIIYLSPEK